METSSNVSAHWLVFIMCKTCVLKCKCNNLQRQPALTILTLSGSLWLGDRSSQEAGGLSHVEPPWQKETREEVHGGAQRHRRGLACPSQEGYRHDAARTEVWMEVKTREKFQINEGAHVCGGVPARQRWGRSASEQICVNTRLTLCRLCLLSRCSKSVYSKSLDIPDARTKRSKEERYSLPLFPSSCSPLWESERCSGAFCPKRLKNKYVWRIV